MAQIMNASEVGGEAPTSGDDLGTAPMNTEVMEIGDAIAGAEPAGLWHKRKERSLRFNGSLSI